MLLAAYEDEMVGADIAYMILRHDTTDSYIYIGVGT